MIQKLRKLLYPFTLLYKGVTTTRNKLYDRGILESNAFDIPLITVGNLRVGGTGKTPQVAYLVKLLKSSYRVAVLSRGYKRKSKGFVLANKTKTAIELGDEPYQLFRQHPDIVVAVDADRTHGIAELCAMHTPPDVILLDDAFQHRKVQSGFSILLTAYDDLYIEDTHLPSGNLRESVEGAKRAQVIVVTKCPDVLSEQEEFDIALKLKVGLKQTVFFTRIKYAEYIQSTKQKIAIDDLSKYKLVLITGIANPKPLVNFLELKKCDFEHLSYPDHHQFSKMDIENIQKEFLKIPDKNKLLLTTEKDYVRIFASLENLYYLAIETEFINHQKDFDKLILDYVGKNTRNSKISKGERI
jgi:tetraacyldisaccharide 4'-kinase